MRATLVKEDDNYFHLHDGKAPFRVAKSGVSKDTADRIRAHGKKMSEGGVADEEAGLSTEPKTKKEALQEGVVVGEQTQAAKDASTPSIDAGATQSVDPSILQSTQPPPGAMASYQPAPGTAPATAPGPIAAPPIARPVVPTVATPPRAAGPDPYDLEQKAVLEKGNIESDLAQQRAAALKTELDARTTAAVQQKQQADDAHAAAMQHMARIQKMSDDLANSDSTIDQGRWWATRSTPQKIAGGIGLLLGALGAGNDGVNRAVGIIDNAISRDVDVQKTQHEMKLKKGQIGLESAQTQYGMFRQQGLDDQAATAAARDAALATVETRLKQAEATAASPLAKNQAQMGLATIMQKRKENAAAMGQRAFENNLKTSELKIKQQEADTAAAKAAAAGSATGKEPLPEAELSKITNIPTSMDSLGKMYTAYKAAGPTGKNDTFGRNYEFVKSAKGSSLAAGIMPAAKENTGMVHDIMDAAPGLATPLDKGRTWFQGSAEAMIQNHENQINVLAAAGKYDPKQIAEARAELDRAKEKLRRAHPDLNIPMSNSGGAADGTVASGPGGAKLIRKAGQWVPLP